MNKIAVVVVTYNRLKLLKKCIYNLKNQRNVDIIVINNASTDETEKYIQSIKNEKIIYCNTGKNLGGAGGFSYGIKKAYELNYEYVLVMDDDTMIQGETIDELTRAINEVKDFSFLACKVLWKDNNLCLMNKPKVSNNILEYHKYISDGIIAVDSSSFVGCLINMKCVEKVGLPISEFFIWGDDVEFTTRLSKIAPGYLVSKSVVIHECANNDSINIYNEKNIERIKRYKYLYRNRFYNFRKKGILGILKYFAILFRDLVYIILKGKYKLMKIAIVLKGFILGIFFYPRIKMVSKNDNSKEKN